MRNSDRQPTVDSLAALRKGWEERRAAMAVVLQRIDVRGMSRPARAPEEQAWLAERGVDVQGEDEQMAELARAYYARRYQR